MDNKKALELVNSLLEDHKRDDLKTVLGDILTEMRSNHLAPLKKAISEVQEELRKVDPTTKLPGTLLDKQMGDMQSNLNPEKGADQSTGMVKADPASAAPMLGSEKKHDWKGFMAKAMTCSEKMQKANFGSSGTKQIGVPNAEPKKKMMSGFSMASSVAAPAAAPGASMGKNEMQKAAPPLGGTGMGAPSTPTARPDKGFGAVVVKASEHEQGVHQRSIIPQKTTPHMENHNSSAAGDEARTGQNWPNTKAMGNAKEAHKMILSKLKGMPKPNLTRSEEKPENQKDMSASAKTAIMEPSDKPMKVQPNRPGQANKPVKC